MDDPFSDFLTWLVKEEDTACWCDIFFELFVTNLTFFVVLILFFILFFLWGLVDAISKLFRFFRSFFKQADK